MEKVLLEPLATTADSTFLEKYPLRAAAIIEEEGQTQQEQEQEQEQQEQIKIIDVFGQQTEPICNYHTCHHKFLDLYKEGKTTREIVKKQRLSLRDISHILKRHVVNHVRTS
jgi:hypothetical protein